MADPIHLITEQDIHAYVDGELTADRRRAVEAFLADRGVPAEAATSYLRQGLDLLGAREAIYERDPALRSEVEALMVRHGGRRRAASFRAVPA